MDGVLFGLKRAHQSSLRFSRKATHEFGLTPARFDMLFAIKNHRMWSGEIFQTSLVRLLGVSGAVVSRMLTALEELDLVHRAPRQRRRTRLVSLTVRGLALIRRAAKRLLFSGRAFVVLARALRSPRDDTSAFTRREELDDTLDALRGFFGDRATLFYRWHPDD